jgi:oligopeptide transport system ATP-binding protein
MSVAGTPTAQTPLADGEACPSAAPLLQAQRLSVHFAIEGGVLRRVVGCVRAVTDVDLELHEGDVLGIVGESGCGKTTLGRTLVGLYLPTGGTLRYAGRDLAAMSATQRRQMARDVQMVFQDPYASLNPRQRVRKILATPFDCHGLPADAVREARLRELLDLVGLASEHLDRFPHEFSGGERQRIGIARALALQPRVVVLDEPLSALDMSIQSQVLNLLVDLQARLKLSYVFISHDLTVVRYLCDSVAVMYLGRIVEAGPAADLFADPLHPYTRSLLDAAPSPDPRRKRPEYVLQGDVPSPSHPPAGCAFHTRCPLAVDRCRHELPPLRPLAGGRRVACHLV